MCQSCYVCAVHSVHILDLQRDIIFVWMRAFESIRNIRTLKFKPKTAVMIIFIDVEHRFEFTEHKSTLIRNYYQFQMFLIMLTISSN